MKEELLGALKGKSVVGALDCAGVNGALEACAEVVAKSEGKKFVATVQQVPGTSDSLFFCYVDRYLRAILQGRVCEILKRTTQVLLDDRNADTQ